MGAHPCVIFLFFSDLKKRLNIYGYRRIQHGPLKGGYVHKSFIRYRPELSSTITRRGNHHAAAKVEAASAVAAKVMEMVTVSGNQMRVSPDADPTQLEEVFEGIDYEPINNLAQSVDFGSCNLQAVLDRIFLSDQQPVDGDQRGETRNKNHHHKIPSFILPSVVSSSYQGGKAMQGDSRHYRTASGILVNSNQMGHQDESDMEALLDMLANSGAPGEDDERATKQEAAAVAVHSPSSESSSSQEDEEQESEEQLSERIFPLKLHKMLENAHRDGIEHIVSWVPGGFKVHDSKLFTEQVMPMWFDQTKYESFRRQLNLYNFARISRGPQRGVYSHPAFVPGRRDLLGNITRKINGEVQPPKPQPVKPPPVFARLVPSTGYQHPPQCGRYPDEQQHSQYAHSYGVSDPVDDTMMSYY
jgi:hypothetical protein